MPPHVVIVGAGPAGMNAALEADRRGARVTVLDEAPKPGGQIFRQRLAQGGPALTSNVGLASELRRKNELLDRFDRILDRIDYRPEHTAYALFEGPELHVSGAQASEVLRPDAVVLATGVSERAVPFPGWTMPGVVYAGAAQALLKSQGIKIGQRMVVAGAGPLPLAVAAQLSRAGVDVASVALLHPLSKILAHPLALWAGRSVMREAVQYMSILRRHRVPVLTRTVPVRVDGQHQVESILLCSHDGTGRHLPGTEQRIECNAVALNYGFTVNSELANMAGAESEYSSSRGGWIPVSDQTCRTSVYGVLVAGDGAGLRGAWVAQAEGTIAGAAATLVGDEDGQRRLEQEMRAAYARRRQHERFQQAIQQSLQLPAGVWKWAEDDTVVCRCECVRLKRLHSAFDQGHLSVNAIKRNTRVGMGWCGGRMCLQNVAAYASPGGVRPDLSPMTPRPLARPVNLSALKNQGQA